MTLSASSAADRYAAAEAQTVFPYTFKILDAAHLKIYEDETEVTTGFIISGVGSDTGGNVTYTTAPRQSGDAAMTVTLKRVLPLSQPDDLPSQGALNTDTLEGMIDRLAMVAQQLNEELARAVKFAISSTLTGQEVTPVASSVIGFDAAGTGLTTYPSSGLAATITPTSYMETLLDDATAAEAAATLAVMALGGGTMTGLFKSLSVDNITAGATQTQAGATALTAQFNRITTSAANGDGVKLPAAAPGLGVWVSNADAGQTIDVWPATGDKIAGGSAEAVDPTSIAPGAARFYYCLDTTDWRRDIPVGTVLQRVVVETSSATNNSTTTVVATGLTSAISCLSASSKVRIAANGLASPFRAANLPTRFEMLVSLWRGAVVSGTKLTEHVVGHIDTSSPNAADRNQGSVSFLHEDAPATKAATTYVVGVASWHTDITAQFNGYALATTMILEEIAA